VKYREERKHLIMFVSSFCLVPHILAFHSHFPASKVYSLHYLRQWRRIEGSFVFFCFVLSGKVCQTLKLRIWSLYEHFLWIEMYCFERSRVPLMLTCWRRDHFKNAKSLTSSFIYLNWSNFHSFYWHIIHMKHNSSLNFSIDMICLMTVHWLAN